MTNPVYENNLVKLYNEDALTILKETPDSSIDAIITDPPYGMSDFTTQQINETLKHWTHGNDTYTPPVKGGIYGMTWDAFIPTPNLWKECLRVLKPGGYLTSFSATRTTDLISIALRLAGFEIKDIIAWHNHGVDHSRGAHVLIDKANGKATKEDIQKVNSWIEETIGIEKAKEITGIKSIGTNTKTPIQPKALTKIEEYLGHKAPEEINNIVTIRNDYDRREITRWESSEILPSKTRYNRNESFNRKDLMAVKDKAYGVEAQKYENHTTSFYPTLEPIIVARKPLEGTYIENLRKYGTGFMLSKMEDGSRYKNIMMDEAAHNKYSEEYVKMPIRSFFVAKPSENERITLEDGRRHPTVKPLTLMRELIKIFCPEDGTLFEPFSGSGTTLEAAILEGRKAVGVELDESYIDFNLARFERVGEKENKK